MKSFLNGFSKGFGYTLGRILLFSVLSYFILSNLRGCNNETVKDIFDAVLA